MKRPLLRQLGLLGIAVLGGVGLAVAMSAWPQQRQTPMNQGQTLLGQAGDSFSDEQTGLQFKPPQGWSMQTRSLAAPDQRLSPRLIVKYKRLIPNVAVAWVRVYVHNVPDQPSEYLKKRKLPEKGWKIAKEVESEVEVGKFKSARITYAGPLDADGRGSKDFTAEYYALREGSSLFEIAGTFPSNDEEAKKQWRATIDSVTFAGR